MDSFKIGQKYSTRSICDHNCIYTIEVLKRTPKTVTVREHSDVKTLRVFIDYNGNEAVKPHGSYSMAAIISADDADLSVAANTAQLRDAAFDAERAGRFTDAAKLYAAAADAYPAHRADSQLARDDIAGLRKASSRCAAMAVAS